MLQRCRCLYDVVGGEWLSCRARHFHNPARKKFEQENWPGLTRFRKMNLALNEVSVVQGDKMMEGEEDISYIYMYCTRCISSPFLKACN
jgi:hypothetical protein